MRSWRQDGIAVYGTWVLMPEESWWILQQLAGLVKDGYEGRLKRAGNIGSPITISGNENYDGTLIDLTSGSHFIWRITLNRAGITT